MPWLWDLVAMPDPPVPAQPANTTLQSDASH